MEVVIFTHFSFTLPFLPEKGQGGKKTNEEKGVELKNKLKQSFLFQNKRCICFTRKK